MRFLLFLSPDIPPPSPPLLLNPTGKWTVQQAADLGIAASTISASLDSRYISALKSERCAAATIYEGVWVKPAEAGAVTGVDKQQLVDDVRKVGWV